MTTQAERQLDQLTAQQDADQLAAEQAAQQAAAAKLHAELVAITAALLLLRDGEESDHTRQVIAALAARLAEISFDPVPALERHADRALALGRRHAREQVSVGQAAFTSRLPSDRPSVTPAVRAVIDAAELRAREHLVTAAGLLTVASGQPQRLAAMGVAQRAVGEIHRAAAFVVTRSAADAVTASAVELGASRLWVGERDACLHCLAYFGHIADGEHPFPAQLTYARKPLSGVLGEPVVNPPLHPHCRCRIIVWVRSALDAGSTSYPEALKREARRSVLRGWSLESESESSRLDAANRLLHRAAGQAMPKSVQHYAEQAVKRGVFSRGRAVPGRAIK